MQLFGIVVLSTLVCGPPSTQETTPEKELGQALAEAIATNDVVGYSQCWISSRRMVAMMKELGVSEMPVDRLREYEALRNKSIAESFKKIQKLIDDRKLDRKSILLKSCTAAKLRKRKAPKGTLTKTEQFSVLLTVGDEEWRFEIDDGVLHAGMWYFSDSPINLFAGNRTLSFKDHRK
jgi:hypothetical protein